MFNKYSFLQCGAPGAGGEQQGIGGLVTSFLPLILIFCHIYFLLIMAALKNEGIDKQMLDNLREEVTK